MKKIATLDIEASGLSPASYPIEVGVVLPSGESWCSLVKPVDEWQYWCDEAQSIHHISQQQIIDHGKNITDIATILNQLLEGQVVYSDCWVLDDRWLKKLYAEAKMEASFRLRDIIYLLKEEQFENWESEKKIIADELALSRHRATNDARILQETFYRINL